MSATVRMLRIASAMCLVLCLAAPRVGAQTNPAVVGQWETVAPLPFYSTALHLLPTGMVMYYSNGVAYPGGIDARLWDPATGTTLPMAAPGYNVFCSGHAFLADGRLLIAGGHIINNVGLPNASIYDPVSNAWTAAPNMNAGRWYPTATTLANAEVLVIAGQIDTTVGINSLAQVFQPSGSSGTSRPCHARRRSLAAAS